MTTMKLFAIAMLVGFSNLAVAQISVSVNFGPPPLWGPVGYTEARYYYLPDVEAYYDIQSSMFIYFDTGRWISRTNLPRRYRNYDLYNGYKVVMSYRGNTPYENFDEHRIKYGKGYHGELQKTVGERPDRGNHRVRNANSRSEGRKQEGENKRGKGRNH